MFLLSLFFSASQDLVGYPDVGIQKDGDRCRRRVGSRRWELRVSMKRAGGFYAYSKA